MKLYHKVIKFRHAQWYFEVWVTDGEQHQKIRNGNTPYKTKQEATQQADERVRTLTQEYAHLLQK